MRENQLASLARPDPLPDNKKAQVEFQSRVAGRTENLREAVRIGNEVETLYTNGPAAGGGAWKSARDVVAVASVLLPRELAKPQVRFVGA